MKKIKQEEDGGGLGARVHVGRSQPPGTPGWGSGVGVSQNVLGEGAANAETGVGG